MKARRVLLLLLLGPTPPVHARDAEVWASLEARVPMAPPGGLAPTALRFQAQPRWRTGPVALELVQVRGGLLWSPADLLRASVNMLVRGQHGRDATFRTEYRLDLEPTLQLELGGPWALSNRHRLEARWLPERLRWRYRTQVALTLEPAGVPLTPFLSEEALVDLSGRGLDENRVILGVRRPLLDGSWLEAGYLLRVAKREQAWQMSHILLLSLVFSPPPRPRPPAEY